MNLELPPSESCIRLCLKLTTKWVSKIVNYISIKTLFCVDNYGRPVSEKSINQKYEERNGTASTSATAMTNRTSGVNEKPP